MPQPLRMNTAKLHKSRFDGSSDFPVSPLFSLFPLISAVNQFRFCVSRMLVRLRDISLPDSDQARETDLAETTYLHRWTSPASRRCSLRAGLMRGRGYGPIGKLPPIAAVRACLCLFAWCLPLNICSHE